MSSTIESKSARDTREHPTNSRVSSFGVRPSVAGMIADSEGNLDEKKTVAALSQTHNANKYLWTGSFVLIGVVLLLIAANIGISVVVARLTRQINVDPVTGMASISGSDDVVMKTSEARYKEEDLNFHNVRIDHLSAVKTVEFNDGHISFDVKGFARMSNETILIVEGGALMFDVIGFKNITGDGLTRLFSSIGEDMKSSDLHGRKLDHTSVNAVTTSPGRNPYCMACGRFVDAGMSVPEVDDMDGGFPMPNGDDILIRPSDYAQVICCIQRGYAQDYQGNAQGVIWGGGAVCDCPDTPLEWSIAHLQATENRMKDF